MLADLDSTFVGVDLTATNKSCWATSRTEGSGWFLPSNTKAQETKPLVLTLSLLKLMKTTLLCLTCFFAVAASTEKLLPFLKKDHVCPDGEQHCETGSPCCAFTPGAYGCCTADETCCADDKGGVCCEAQPTYCVPKNTSLSSFPARCCPRFTVGCVAGTVGCCDPSTPWQRGRPLSPGVKSGSVFSAYRGGRKQHEKPKGTHLSVLRERNHDTNMLASSAGTSNGTAYALVTNGVAPGLIAWTIDLASGNITRKIPVNGYNTAGENTRDFLYDRFVNLFYQFDVDFVHKRPAAGRDITMTTIDPTTGSTSTIKLTGGAKDYVTGFCIDTVTKNMMIATDNGVEWSFYDVDTKTGECTLKGTLTKGGDESSASFYAGYHRICDGKSAMRLGFESVVNQMKPGLGSVHFGSGVTAEWNDAVPVPDETPFYYSAQPYKGSFVSLAPNATTTLFNVYQWSLPGKKAKLVAELPGGPPRVMGSGQLGFVLDALSDDTYIALVDKDSPVPIPYPGTWDTWAMAVVDLTTGAQKFLPLSPAVLEGTTSVSGLGLPVSLN